MKLKKEFVTYSTDEKHLVVCTDTKMFSGIVQSNATGGQIIELMKEETTRDQVIQEMLKEYSGSEELIVKDVDKVIEKLRSIGALEE